jgi:hypothetical protein
MRVETVLGTINENPDTELHKIESEITDLIAEARELDKSVFKRDIIHSAIKSYYSVNEYTFNDDTYKIYLSLKEKLKEFISVAKETERYIAKLKVLGISIGRLKADFPAHEYEPVTLNIEQINISEFNGKTLEFGKLAHGNVQIPHYIFYDLARHSEINFDFTGVNFSVQKIEFFTELFRFVKDDSSQYLENIITINYDELAKGLYTYIKHERLDTWEGICNIVPLLNEFYQTKEILHVGLQNKFRPSYRDMDNLDIWAHFKIHLSQYCDTVYYSEYTKRVIGKSPVFRPQDLKEQSENLLTEIIDTVILTNSISSIKLISDSNIGPKKYEITYNKEYISKLHALVQPLNELVFATSDWVDKYYK